MRDAGRLRAQRSTPRPESAARARALPQRTATPPRARASRSRPTHAAQRASRPSLLSFRSARSRWHQGGPLPRLQVGGISLGEINALEVEFLTRLSFRLHVLPEQFEAVCARLCSELTTDDAAAADAAAEAAPAEQGGAAPAGYVAGGKAYAAQAVA